uniref:Tubulin epsilon 1 n=1 Tax=Seriola dumerili TaxID=41447 RepID=A0A3B4U5P2_SERDU
MTQSVVVQVGQCGNQVGCRFWDLALREHSHVNKKGLYDEALSSFFRNVDSRKGDGRTCGVGGRIQHLKARAVLVDMEEGVVNEILQGPLREVFDSTQLLTDVSGSGNNWAVGHMTYGSAYREQIVEKLRRAAEHCDCLQCFFLIHSMGGGTGSGLGTRVLSLLEEEFPEVCRIVTSIYPSAEDDVITSPYNSVLAMRELTEHADCVLPVENQSLVDIVSKIQHMSHGAKPGQVIRRDSAIISGRGGLSAAEKPFDAMNNIVANLLLSITSSARFEGSLNMDLNEIAMNLVPFPRLHYLVPSLTPLYTLADVSVPTRRLDQMFSDAFSKDHQLIRADPKRSLYLACALMVRGNVQVSDLRRNIERPCFPVARCQEKLKQKPTEAVAALRLVEPGGLEDGPVFGASRGSLPLPVGPGQQHLCEAHIRGAEGAFHQTLQEEGSPASLPACRGDGAELLLGGHRLSRITD